MSMLFGVFCVFTYDYDIKKAGLPILIICKNAFFLFCFVF